MLTNAILKEIRIMRENSDNTSVAVMMSSYNGELYIEEQLKSILDQTGVDVYLYIRDDGSSDKTIQILQKYSMLDNVNIEIGRHLGVGISFMELLCSVPQNYDYYAFSDQDDIWENDKLITAVRCLREEKGCALYASNLECVDANNNSIGMLYGSDMLRDWSLFSVILSGRCYGCTQVFNRELLLVVRSRQPSNRFLKTRLHDTWVSVSAAATGKIIFDMESHIRYRRHGNNYSTINSERVDVWKSRFSKLIHEEKRNPRSKTASEVVKIYPEYVKKDRDRDMIYILADPWKISNRIVLIKNRDKFISLTTESDAWFITKVIAGLV